MRLIWKPLSTLAAVLTLASLAACAPYITPANLTPENSATISGSKTHDAGVLSANSHVFPAWIDDGKVLSGGLSDSPVRLSAGEHEILYGVTRDTFPYESAQGKFKFDFQPGVAYTMMVSDPVPSVDANGQASSWPDQCKIWLQTPDGHVASPQITVQLNRPAVSDIPVFLPAH